MVYTYFSRLICRVEWNQIGVEFASKAKNCMTSLKCLSNKIIHLHFSKRCYWMLQRGCHILVATPGRLHDFVDRSRVSFDSIRFVVLDEADRMLDMGFIPSVEKMMEHPTMVNLVSLVFGLSMYPISRINHKVFDLWVNFIWLANQSLWILSASEDDMAQLSGIAFLNGCS